MAADPHHLQRFLDAQDDVYEQVIHELRTGLKRTHWMWFIFPQVAGLGRSEMAQHYGIKSLDEARAYLAHPVLGSRLLECSQAVLTVAGKTAHDIFGSPDDLKLASSATLFAEVSSPPSVFDRILEKYYGGHRDDGTVAIMATLGRGNPPG